MPPPSAATQKDYPKPWSTCRRPMLKKLRSELTGRAPAQWRKPDGRGQVRLLVGAPKRAPVLLIGSEAVFNLVERADCEGVEEAQVPVSGVANSVLTVAGDVDRRAGADCVLLAINGEGPSMENVVQLGGLMSVMPKPPPGPRGPSHRRWTPAWWGEHRRSCGRRLRRGPHRTRSQVLRSTHLSPVPRSRVGSTRAGASVHGPVSTRRSRALA